MKINYNRMIQSNLLSNMCTIFGHESNSSEKEGETGIELQILANRALASSARNHTHTHQLFVKDQEILHLQSQIKKKNKIISTLSVLLIATSIIAVLFWTWAIHLRDSIVWHNYTKHNSNNIESVVTDEIE